jgi:hypothetical protein
VIFSIPVTKADFSVMGRNNPIVGQRHAVGVAAEVVQNIDRRSEGFDCRKCLNNSALSSTAKRFSPIIRLFNLPGNRDDTCVSRFSLHGSGQLSPQELVCKNSCRMQRLLQNSSASHGDMGFN